MEGIRRQDETGQFGLPLRPEIRIHQPRAEEVAAGTWAMGVNAAARSAHTMDAPLPGRLVQFLDRIDLAAHAAGAAAAAQNNVGFGVSRGRILDRIIDRNIDRFLGRRATEFRPSSVFARHVASLQRRPAAALLQAPTPYHKAGRSVRSTAPQNCLRTRPGSILRRFRGDLPPRSPFRCWRELRGRPNGWPETGPCLRASSSTRPHSCRERS
jgi:hypothetical protein